MPQTGMKIIIGIMMMGALIAVGFIAFTRVTVECSLDLTKAHNFSIRIDPDHPVTRWSIAGPCTLPSRLAI